MRCIRQIAVAAIILFCAAAGCRKASPVEATPPEYLDLPALTDPVPYDRLPDGKLVFERIGLLNNSYSGVYVIDGYQHHAYGVARGVFDGPAVSPDGRSILYTTYTGPTTAYDVYVMNIDGHDRRCISDIVGQESSPSWTPDGTQIIFQAFPFNNKNGIQPLYRQSPVPNPSDRVLLIDFGLINPPYIYFPDGPVSASPTGRLVVSASGIRTMDANGRDQRLIIPWLDGTAFYSPTWSPDGRHIAVLCLSQVNSRITSLAVVLYTSDGTQPDTLVTLPASEPTLWSGDNTYSLCWSPDGSQIAFTRPEGTTVGSHIYLIRPDHTGLTQVTFAEGVTDRSLSWGR